MIGFSKHILILFSCSFLFISGFLAQEQITADTIIQPDTIVLKKEKKHSPSLATLMSVAVPGAGQVYNKKYWKVPIIYAGIGTSLYFAFSNNKEYKKYKEAYVYRIDGDSTTTDDFVNVLSEENLKSNMDAFRRNRDFSFIIAGLFYVMNIIDATVDAHLFTFPVNDNLSFKLEPQLQLTNNNQISKGFTLVINL